jgi:hypothetical protein
VQIQEVSSSAPFNAHLTLLLLSVSPHTFMSMENDLATALTSMTLSGPDLTVGPGSSVSNGNVPVPTHE